MKISKVVEFLEKTRETDGDLEVQSITGFWIREDPKTGDPVVVCCVGDGQPLA